MSNGERNFFVQLQETKYYINYKESEKYWSIRTLK